MWRHQKGTCVGKQAGHLAGGPRGSRIINFVINLQLLISEYGRCTYQSIEYHADQAGVQDRPPFWRQLATPPKYLFHQT